MEEEDKIYRRSLKMSSGSNKDNILMDGDCPKSEEEFPTSIYTTSANTYIPFTFLPNYSNNSLPTMYNNWCAQINQQEPSSSSRSESTSSTQSYTRGMGRRNASNEIYEGISAHRSQSLFTKLSTSNSSLSTPPTAMLTPLEFVTAAASVATVPEQLEQNLLIGEALLTSPHNLVAKGLLAPDVLSNQALWDQWMCGLATSLSPLQWQTYWRMYTTIFGVNALPTHLLSFFGDLISPINKYGYTSQKLNDSFAMDIDDAIEINKKFLKKFSLVDNRCE